MRRPWVPLVAILLAGPLGTQAQAEDERAVHWIAGSPALEGEERLDTYEEGVTALLSATRASQLRHAGYVPEPVPTTVARGLLRGDPRDGFSVPPGLAASPNTERHVVQFRGPVKEEWMSRLAGAATIHDYLPSNAFLVRLASGARNDVATWPEVRSLAPYHPAFKISPHLAADERVTVLAYPDAAMAELRDAIEVAGGRVDAAVTRADAHALRVASSDPQRLAKLEDVFWIEPSHDVATLDNAVASATTQSGQAGAWPLHDRGVDGSTQVVGICDTGVNTLAAGVTDPAGDPVLLRAAHEAFEATDPIGLVQYNPHLSATPLPLPPHRKIALYYSPQEDGNRGDATDHVGHGTATAATLAGDREPFGERTENDGIAPAARLAVCDAADGFNFFVLLDYTAYWDPAYDVGARVHSNSWGSDPSPAYTDAARQHDAYAWAHRDFLVVRSMGNTGPDAWFRPEAGAKSVLAVGATVNDGMGDAVSSSSSEGPTEDGRTKPNVVAPGQCLVTATLPDPDSYACQSGTSFSTPVVAGAAALVRDYFEKGYYPSGTADPADAFSPSAALVRAVLQVSGREMSGDRGEPAFPNPVQGWGRVALDDALAFAGDEESLWVRDEGRALRTGQTARIPLHVTSSGPLRVMLAWTDAPGAAGASPALVNDLDLRIVGPDGSVHVGNGETDRRNVEEAIYLETSTPGRYTIEVHGVNVPQGPQPFALVATSA